MVQENFAQEIGFEIQALIRTELIMSGIHNTDFAIGNSE